MEETQITNEQFDYIDSFNEPAEFDFLNEAQKKSLEDEKKKLDESLKYYKTMLQRPDWTEETDKFVLNGDVYSIGQAMAVADKFKALNWYGYRLDVSKSLVTPTGQRVIASSKLSDILGYQIDGYITEPFDELERILVEEKVGPEQLKLLKDAESKYGVILIQKGMYASLKPLIDDALAINNVKTSFQVFKTNLEKPDVNSQHGASLSQLKGVLQSQPSVSNGPVMTPAEIKREVGIKELPDVHHGILPPPHPPAGGTPILNHSSEKNFPPKAPDAQPKWVNPPLAPKPTPGPRPAPAPAIPQPKLNSNPSSGLASIKDIKVIDDLKKIEAAHLRQGYLPEQIKMIRTKIAYLAAVNKILPIQVANVFEQSPLFKLYLAIGSAIMSSSGGDAKPDYKQLVANMAQKGQEVLSFAEFEGIADLRKDLEHM